MYSKLKPILKIRAVKLILELAVIVLVFIAIKSFMQRSLIDGPLPHIQGHLLDGQPVHTQTFKGEPLLLHFWATWCPVCKMEQDSINDISKDHNVITIAMNSGNDLEVQAFLEENNLSFPVILDEDGTIAQRFGVSGVPTSFIVGADGDIAFTEVGYTTNWGLRLRLWLADK